MYNTFSLQKDKVIEFTKNLMLMNWWICSKLVFLSLPSSCSTNQEYYHNLLCFINTVRNFICFILSWPYLLLLYIGLITKSYLIQSIYCELQGLDILSIFLQSFYSVWWFSYIQVKIIPKIDYIFTYTSYNLVQNKLQYMSLWKLPLLIFV